MSKVFLFFLLIDCQYIFLRWHLHEYFQFQTFKSDRFSTILQSDGENKNDVGVDLKIGDRFLFT